MPDLTVSRQERLRGLEEQVRQGSVVLAALADALLEIREDRLYQEAGFATWDAYLRTRVEEEFGIKRTQAFALLACAQIRPRLPPLSGTPDNGEWSQRELLEFGRLAPQAADQRGQPRDYTRLDRRDAARVVQKVREHCEREGVPHSTAVVRKFVDEALSVDRSPEARARRRESQLPDLVDVMRGWSERARRWAGELKEVLPYLNDYLDREPVVARNWREQARALADLLNQAAARPAK
jgi:hypothetical protein